MGDVGGQQTIRSYWRNYYEQTDGLIWVVDSNDTGRLEDCKTELHALLLEERLAGASVLIFTNKQDISTAMSPQQIQEFLDISGSEQKRHINLVSCSAVTGDGLVEGIDWIVSDIANRIFMMD
eukprot:NODE_2474_length_471_cov_521.104265_g2040_i0.p1 GENE.NODE_2474_length_471_cov_521.104265_g2040_i0~~NODE_2474_length_471_cov_521.104265_g2040_i0.p1  ORF type:complete len:131 (-),score=26.74 NODE_2474_length_471_cov_521.104265_g2040_i0:79-447(-)